MLTILIPYFGGDSSAANSLKANRLRYLRKTLENTRMLSRDIVIGVCAQADRGVDPRTVILDCDPIHLATALCAYAQAQVASDFFYVTEADQIAHYAPNVFDVVQGDTYLIPHRLERIVEDEQSGVLVGSDRGTVVRFRGQLYVLPNGSPEMAWGASDYYEPETCRDRFGGAYLATASLFRKVDFAPGGTYPVEQATGFRIAEAGTPLKTGVWRDFFVEHLSGVEYHRSLLVEAA